MKDRLISADALMREVETLISNNKQLIDEWFANVITDAIDDAPTVDAEPLVRCKDCENWVENEHCLAWAYEYSDANGYCYLGKRRKDAETKADRNGFVKQDDLFPQG